MRDLERGRGVGVRVPGGDVLRCLELARGLGGHVQHPDHGVGVQGRQVAVVQVGGEAEVLRGEVVQVELVALPQDAVKGTSVKLSRFLKRKFGIFYVNPFYRKSI